VCADEPKDEEKRKVLSLLDNRRCWVS